MPRLEGWRVGLRLEVVVQGSSRLKLEVQLVAGCIHCLRSYQAAVAAAAAAVAAGGGWGS